MSRLQSIKPETSKRPKGRISFLTFLIFDPFFSVSLDDAIKEREKIEMKSNDYVQRFCRYF
jgi:hypothetical protein